MDSEIRNAPEKIQLFSKARESIKAHTTKGFSIQEVIGMAGVLAEASVAFYYSPEIREKYTREDVGDIAARLINGTKALMEHDKKVLDELDELDECFCKNVWDDIAEVYGKYIADKAKKDLGHDDDEEDEGSFYEKEIGEAETE